MMMVRVLLLLLVEPRRSHLSVRIIDWQSAKRLVVLNHTAIHVLLSLRVVLDPSQGAWFQVVFCLERNPLSPKHTALWGIVSSRFNHG